jgi:O-antigen ligase
MTAALTASLLLGTIAALVLVARKPEWGAPVFAFVIFIRLSDALRGEFGTPSVFQFLAPGLLLILVARWLFSGERVGEGWRPAVWLLAAYAAVCMLSILYAQDVERTGAELMKQIDGVLIVIVMSSFIRGPQDLRRVVWALLLAGLFLSSLTVLQQLTGSFENNFAGFSHVESRNLYGDQAGGRAEGPVSANYYAILLVLLVPMAVDRSINERSGKVRAVAGFALLLFLSAIVFTYSRGALVSLAVVGLMLVIWLRMRWVVAVGAMALLILPFVLPRDYLERASTFTQVIGILSGEAPRDSAIRGRLSEVTSAAMMFGDAPLLGVGYGNFELHYPRYARELALDARRTDRAAHNLYLEVAAETGVVGLSAFGLLLGYAVTGIGRARRRAENAGDPDLVRLVTGFGIGVVGYLTGSLFLHLSYPRYFWLLLGVAFGLEAIARGAQQPVLEPLRLEPRGEEAPA